MLITILVCIINDEKFLTVVKTQTFSKVIFRIYSVFLQVRGDVFDTFYSKYCNPVVYVG